tara:strand:- start:319 stop:651 length:333 start_codon:yes stop_codon:yes gene_type:complete
MVVWKKGQKPGLQNSNPLMLEGATAIAAYIGKCYNTTLEWIWHFGLPAAKNRQGVWISHKALILQWILSKNRLDLEHRARKALTVEAVREAAVELGVDPDELFDEVTRDR